MMHIERCVLWLSAIILAVHLSLYVSGNYALADEKTRDLNINVTNLIECSVIVFGKDHVVEYPYNVGQGQTVCRLAKDGKYDRIVFVLNMVATDGGRAYYLQKELGDNQEKVTAEVAKVADSKVPVTFRFQTKDGLKGRREIDLEAYDAEHKVPLWSTSVFAAKDGTARLYVVKGAKYVFAFRQLAERNTGGPPMQDGEWTRIKVASDEAQEYKVALPPLVPLSCKVQVLEKTDDGVRPADIRVMDFRRQDGRKGGYQVKQGCFYVTCGEPKGRLFVFAPGEKVTLLLLDESYEFVDGRNVLEVGKPGSTVNVLIQRTVWASSAWSFRARSNANADLSDVIAEYKGENGTVWIAGLPGRKDGTRPGKYDLRVWKYGYRLFSRGFDLKAGNNWFDVVIRPARKAAFEVVLPEAFEGGGGDEKSLEVEVRYSVVSRAKGAHNQTISRTQRGDFWYDPALNAILLARMKGMQACIVKCDEKTDVYKLKLRPAKKRTFEMGDAVNALVPKTTYHRVIALYPKDSPRSLLAWSNADKGVADIAVASGQYRPVVRAIWQDGTMTRTKEIVCKVVGCDEDTTQIVLVPDPVTPVSGVEEY